MLLFFFALSSEITLFAVGLHGSIVDNDSMHLTAGRARTFHSYRLVGNEFLDETANGLTRRSNFHESLLFQDDRLNLENLRR